MGIFFEMVAIPGNPKPVGYYDFYIFYGFLFGGFLILILLSWVGTKYNDFHYGTCKTLIKIPVCYDCNPEDLFTTENFL